MDKVYKTTQLRKVGIASIIGAVAALAAPAFASTIATIEGEPGTVGVSFGTATDPAAVVTAIATIAGTTGDGYTYTNNAFLVNDGTGSVDVFGHFPTGDTYVPAIGDGITATGTYAPFDQIPEVDALTAISKVSSGNAYPGPGAEPIMVTVPQLDAIPLTGTPNLSLQAYLVELTNVTISAGVDTTYPTHADLTMSIADSASHTIAAEFDPSSYAIIDPLAGTAIPTGLVDVTGIADVFDGSPEVIPFSITAVPEPVSMGLVAILGGAALLRRRRA
jgi:hypothetical protein